MEAAVSGSGTRWRHRRSRKHKEKASAGQKDLTGQRCDAREAHINIAVGAVIRNIIGFWRAIRQSCVSRNDARQ
jgi:hypothetical protein